jgi:hypothetical protein
MLIFSCHKRLRLGPADDPFPSYFPAKFFFLYFSSIHAAYRAHLIPDFYSLITSCEICTLSGPLGPRLRGYVP